LILWWNTRMHAAREEAESMKATAAGFGVRAARLLIAKLGPLQDDAGTLQVTLPVVRVKGQRGDQSVGGVADLAERDQRVFPPEAAQFGAPRRDD
jgi:hypothetical protein